MDTDKYGPKCTFYKRLEGYYNMGINYCNKKIKYSTSRAWDKKRSGVQHEGGGGGGVRSYISDGGGAETDPRGERKVMSIRCFRPVL